MRGSSLPVSKITPPILPEIYPRSRLFDWLDRASARPVVFVNGPAGSGKTTLIRSYIEHAGMPCLWYQIDEGDHDPGTLFHYLSLAVEKVRSKRSKPLPRFTPECLGGISVFSRKFFQRFYRRLSSPFILVFDNYQKLAPDAGTHEILCHCMEALPFGSRLILLSRDVPPPVIASLHADRGMAVMGWEELCMTPEESEEVAKFLVTGRKSTLNPARASEAARGWIAGLVLLLERGHAGREELNCNETTLGEIYDYFKSEVFERLHRSLKDFLLRTAFLPRMTAEMAFQLTGMKQSGRILSELYRRNFFTERRVHQETVYQYHPLFREFLLSQAHRYFEAGKLSQAQREAAKILETDGEVGESLALWRSLANWEEMIRIISVQAPKLFSQGRISTLEEWLGWIPREIEDHLPWLLYWHGNCHLLTRPEIAARHFERAYELFGFDQNGMGQYLCWSGMVDSCLAGWGDFRALDRWIVELPRLMGRHPRMEGMEIEANVVRGMLSALTLRRMDSPEIHVWVSRAERILPNVPTSNQKVMLGATLLNYYIWVGDHAHAGRIVEKIKPLSDGPEVAPLSRVIWYAWESALAWRLADFESCMHTIDKGLNVLLLCGGQSHLEVALLSQKIYCVLTQGDIPAAGPCLQSIAAKVNGTSYVCLWQYHYVTALEALYRDDIPAVVGHVEASLRHAVEGDRKFFKPVSLFVLVQALLLRQDFPAARACLEEGIRINRSLHNKDVEFQGLLCTAMLDLAEGKEAEGVVFLRQAMLLGKEQGYLNTPWWRPSVILPLLMKALEEGIEVDYVRSLIRRRHLVPDQPPWHIDAWPWSVKIFTLGRFEVQIDEETVHFTGKLQRRPLDLLKVLIALGGREVSEYQLTEVLWPDAEGDMALRSLDTTLHRLRRLLGHSEALVFQGGRLSLNPRRVWVDVWALDQLLGRIEEGLHENPVSREKILKWTEKILASYPGPFLGKGSEEIGSISLRYRMRGKMLRGLEHLGEYWENQKEWTRAADCYWKGMEVDDLAEGFSCRLMVCCQKLNRKADIHGVHRRLEKTMKSRLGIAPSHETEQLYRALMEN